MLNQSITNKEQNKKSKVIPIIAWIIFGCIFFATAGFAITTITDTTSTFSGNVVVQGNVNVTGQNITNIGKACWNPDCSVSTYYNGTFLISGG